MMPKNKVAGHRGSVKHFHLKINSSKSIFAVVAKAPNF